MELRILLMGLLFFTMPRRFIFNFEQYKNREIRGYFECYLQMAKTSSLFGFLLVIYPFSSMKKSNPTRMVAASIALFALAGCSTIALLQDRNIGDLSEPGITLPEVNARLGKPIGSLDTVNGQAICHDYLYTPPNGSETRIYANFRKSDEQLIAFSANLTCEQAQKAGYLNSLERASKDKK